MFNHRFLRPGLLRWRAIGAQHPKRIAQRLESSSHPSGLGKQQPEFCSPHLAGTKAVPIPPASSSGDAAGWTGSRPHRHVAAEPCAGRRMNLLPWQGEACVGLHNGFLLFLSHRGGPATTCPSSRRAGAAWQNPADREARAAPRPRARRCVSLPARGADPEAQGEPPTTGSTPGDGKVLEAGAPSSAELEILSSSTQRGGCLLRGYPGTANALLLLGCLLQDRLSSPAVSSKTPLQL